MKKAFLLLLCGLVIVAAVAACQPTAPAPDPTPGVEPDGPDTDTPDPDVPDIDEPTTDTPRSQPYAELLQSGRYFIHYEREFRIEGSEHYWQVQVAVDGDDHLTETHRDDGFVVLHLVKDGQVYYIDPEAQTVQHMDFMESQPAGGVAFENMTYLDSHIQEFIDQPRLAEVWTDGQRQVIFYLNDDGTLAHLKDHAEGENFLMLHIYELSSDIPAHLQTVPEEYNWLDSP